MMLDKAGFNIRGIQKGIRCPVVLFGVSAVVDLGKPTSNIRVYNA